ncbi:hypothetical protein [Campylobacter concisus]|uniref:hypothetical protein n=1 Tax=Campylobacter concisus TaxID=199 RepID=UPI0015E183BC|nr:hypothetical protein [Campylobacter concisus]
MLRIWQTSLNLDQNLFINSEKNINSIVSSLQDKLCSAKNARNLKIKDLMS